VEVALQYQYLNLLADDVPEELVDACPVFGEILSLANKRVPTFNW
jgi:hypothetical protein